MEKRLIIPTIITILLPAFGFILTFGVFQAGSTEGNDFASIIPGDMPADWSIAMIIPYIVTILAIFIAPYLAFYFARIHKIAKLNKYDYFVIPIEKKLSPARIILRSFFPGLLAINIAIYIATYGVLDPYFIQENIAAEPGISPIAIEMYACAIGAPIAILIIAPIWTLQASGLMCAKKVDTYNRPVTPDIESVSSFYSKTLKGYVGISTITAYALILYQFSQTNTQTISYLIVFLDPIALIFFLVPISTLLEIRLNALNKKLFSRLEKVGINTKLKTIKLDDKQ